MNDSLRGLLALVMLAGAVLACGMPLPSALLTGGITIPACAEGEPEATCDLRQAAFAELAATEMLSVESFSVELMMDNNRDQMYVTSTGRYTYALSEENSVFGANIHLWIDSMTLLESGETDTFENLEIILMGTDAYFSEDGGATWYHDTLDLDQDTQLGLSIFLGLLAPISGEINLFSVPNAFAVQVGKADGGIQQQVLTVDFAALASDAESMVVLLEQAVAADQNLGMGMGIEELGELEEVALMAPMILSMLGDVSYTTRLGIDATSGLLVTYGENLTLDMEFGENDTMQVTWLLDSTLGSYGDVPPVEAPAVFQEGSLDDIIGSPLG